MKLSELLNVIDYSFDYADNEIDATFYADITANNSIANKINVIKINKNYVICDFSNYILQHKTNIEKFLKEYYSPKPLKQYINAIYNTSGEQQAEFLYNFIEIYLAEYLEEKEQTNGKRY